MAQGLTKKEVEYVAQLAQLKLADKEIEKFRQQLSTILEFISQLQELNIEKTEPLSQTTGLKNVLRLDEIKPSLSQAQALANAPETQGGYFKVKAILKK